MKCLLAGAPVAIVIVLALAVIYQPWNRPPTIPGAPTEFRLRCGKCNYEWSVNQDELISKYGAFSTEGSRLVDCPKCGRKRAAFKLVQCPECHTFFTPEQIAPSQAEYKKTGKYLCPRCGIDMHEWYVKRAKEASRRR